MNTHSFDVRVAQIVGLEKAILLQYIAFWIEKNKANKMGLFDGYVWVYHTIEAFLEVFPYFSKSTLGRFLRELEAQGYLKSNQNLEKNKRNRVKYYTLEQKYYDIFDDSKMGIDDSKMGIDDSKMGNVYNDISDINNNIISSKVIKRVIKENISQKCEKPLLNTQDYSQKNLPKNPLIDDYKASFELLWLLYPRKVAKCQALKAYKKRYKDFEQIRTSILEHIQSQWQSNITQGKLEFIPHFATFLNQERYKDNLEQSIQSTKTTQKVFTLADSNLIQKAKLQEEKQARIEGREYSASRAKSIYESFKANSPTTA